jgi:hypothetical protein
VPAPTSAVRTNEWHESIGIYLLAERMNRTIKETTVKRYHYETHDQVRQHLTDTWTNELMAFFRWIALSKGRLHSVVA